MKTEFQNKETSEFVELLKIEEDVETGQSRAIYLDSLHHTVVKPLSIFNQLFDVRAEN